MSRVLSASAGAVAGTTSTDSDDQWTQAVCRTHDRDMFFPNNRGGEAWEATQAKAVCRTCPLIEPCLTGALERHEPWGVWGGELFSRGRIVSPRAHRYVRDDDDEEAA